MWGIRRSKTWPPCPRSHPPLRPTTPSSCQRLSANGGHQRKTSVINTRACQQQSVMSTLASQKHVVSKNLSPDASNDHPVSACQQNSVSRVTAQVHGSQAYGVARGRPCGIYVQQSRHPVSICQHKSVISKLACQKNVIATLTCQQKSVERTFACQQERATATSGPFFSFLFLVCLLVLTYEDTQNSSEHVPFRISGEGRDKIADLWHISWARTQ